MVKSLQSDRKYLCLSAEGYKPIVIMYTLFLGSKRQKIALAEPKPGDPTLTTAWIRPSMRPASHPEVQTWSVFQRRDKGPDLIPFQTWSPGCGDNYSEPKMSVQPRACSPVVSGET